MSSWKAQASRAAPRAAALIWAAYDATRAAAYWTTSPAQLSEVATVMPLWIPWTIAPFLLTAGGCVPPRAGPQSKKLALGMRQWGITLTVMLLMVWGVSFIVADSSRGWVTAGSYVMLAVFASISGWVASREVASVTAISEHDANARVD